MEFLKHANSTEVCKIKSISHSFSLIFKPQFDIYCYAFVLLGHFIGGGSVVSQYNLF